jgi:hypothetical protein
MTSRGTASGAPPRHVFINCPYDDDFRSLLRAICFAIMACGYLPRCALDYSDSGAVRIVEIIRLITECPFSIHDISRVELDKDSKLPRFNMPLELGVDLGLRLAGPRRHRTRRILILDAVADRYDRTLSDIAGMDIEIHGNNPREAIRRVRDWLAINWDEALGKRPAGAAAIWEDYQAYQRIAPDIIAELRLDPHEALHHVDWLHVVRIALPRIAAARSAKD